MRARLWYAAGALTLLACLWETGPALAQEAPAGPVPVKVVGGHLLMQASLANQAGEVHEIVLELALDSPDVLRLHSEQREWLQDSRTAELSFGKDRKITLPIGEISTETDTGRQALQDRLTRFHSGEMGERPVRGTLGTGFFSRYRLTLDLSAGQMLLAPRGPGANLRGTVFNFQPRNGLVHLPLRYADEKTGVFLLGSGAYDTFVDKRVALGLGKPAGDIGPAWLGTPGRGIDLSADLAFRPRASVSGEGGVDAAVLVSGVNLLEIFTVEIDWETSKIGFTRRREARHPREDFEFFRAEAEKSDGQLLAFLQTHPQSWRAAEAASMLMNRRVDAGATDESLMQALQWVADTALAQRRMEACMEYVRRFAAMPQRAALVSAAGTLALQYSRDAVTVQDTYRLHNLIGEALYSQGDLVEAWKHLLSAAFMPLDNPSDIRHNFAVNLNLARVYDRQGRIVRAYSRYRKAKGLLDLKVREDRPTLAEWATQAASEGASTPEAEAQAKSVFSAIGEIDTALERLRRQIPAGNRVLMHE